MTAKSREPLPPCDVLYQKFSPLSHPHWLTNKNSDWHIQLYQLMNVFLSCLYTASDYFRDLLYWRLQLTKPKLSITENNISNKCVDVQTISWFMDICFERWSKFDFENPEQMQLNSWVNHKKKRMGKCQNRTLWVPKNLRHYPHPPRDGFVTLWPKQKPTPPRQRDFWMIPKRY